jgi:hypothetical protein
VKDKIKEFEPEDEYDESSEFSYSLKTASLAPTGFPELREGNPFSRKIRNDSEGNHMCECKHPKVMHGLVNGVWTDCANKNCECKVYRQES